MLRYLRDRLNVKNKGVKNHQTHVHISGSCKGDAAFVTALMFPTASQKQNFNDSGKLPPENGDHPGERSHTCVSAPITTERTPTEDGMKSCRDRQRSIECLLLDKRGVKLFKRFLKSEFSEENIEFLIACEQFKKISRKGKRILKAKKIYHTFIDQESPKQVNLDSAIRSAISTDLSNPTAEMFNQAQKRIQYLLENDSYRRFLDVDSCNRTCTAP